MTTTTATSALGHAIKAYRAKNSLTFKEMGKLADDLPITINRVELGRTCSNVSFVKLVRLLKIKFKDLETFADPKQVIK